MNPYDRVRRGEDWADRRDKTDDAYEPTYRDGSVRHECWNPEIQPPRQRKRNEGETGEYAD